jgi:hypothetical protein
MIAKMEEIGRFSTVEARNIKTKEKLCTFFLIGLNNCFASVD